MTSTKDFRKDEYRCPPAPNGNNRINLGGAGQDFPNERSGALEIYNSLHLIAPRGGAGGGGGGADTVLRSIETRHSVRTATPGPRGAATFTGKIGSSGPGTGNPSRRDRASKAPEDPTCLQIQTSPARKQTMHPMLLTKPPKCGCIL